MSVWFVAPRAPRLVLGISGNEAQRLGRDYGQNAIVVAGRDAVPRVVMVEEQRSRT